MGRSMTPFTFTTSTTAGGRPGRSSGVAESEGVGAAAPAGGGAAEPAGAGAAGPGGGGAAGSVLAITAREALLEYLWLFFRMGAISRTLSRAQVLETVTDGVPGFRDLMVAGKLYELTAWRATSREAEARRRAVYDVVVVDAPP